MMEKVEEVNKDPIQSTYFVVWSVVVRKYFKWSLNALLAGTSLLKTFPSNTEDGQLWFLSNALRH